jgi:hypothetical protein
MSDKVFQFPLSVHLHPLSVRHFPSVLPTAVKTILDFSILFHSSHVLREPDEAAVLCGGGRGRREGVSAQDPSRLHAIATLHSLTEDEERNLPSAVSALAMARTSDAIATAGPFSCQSLLD